MLYGRSKQYQQAVTWFTQCTEIKPSNPLAWLQLGKALQVSNSTDKAIEAYSRAFQLNQMDEEAGTQLAQVRMGSYTRFL